MLRSFAVTSLLALGACASPTGDSDPGPLIVGGPCAYTSHDLTLVVTSIDSTESDSTVDYHLAFDVEGALPEDFRDSPFLTSATLSGRPAGTLGAEGIAVGDRLAGTAEIISEGTCTPVILEVPRLGAVE